MYLNLCGRNVQCERQQEFIYPCLPLSAPGRLLAQLTIPILMYDKWEANSITAGLHSLGLHSPVLGFAWRLLGLRTNNGSGLPPGHLLQLPCGWWRPDHLAIFYPDDSLDPLHYACLVFNRKGYQLCCASIIIVTLTKTTGRTYTVCLLCQLTSVK